MKKKKIINKIIKIINKKKRINNCKFKSKKQLNMKLNIKKRKSIL